MSNIAQTEVQRINELHAEAAKHAACAVEAAAECGQRLLEVKAKLQHGEWLPWCKANVNFSDRTARAYMQVAKEAKWQRVAKLPLRQALKEIGHTRSPEAQITEIAARIRQRDIEARRAHQFEVMAKASQGNKSLDDLGTFPVIYADPPWKYRNQASEARKIENQYAPMPLDEICALPVRDIAHDDAVLFLWVTVPQMRAGLAVMEAWEFDYKTGAVWDKEIIGQGHYFRVQHELLLLGTRGNMRCPHEDSRPSSLIRERRSPEHSRKPKKAYEVIETMYPMLPKIELFARPPHPPGWAVWGNESTR